MRFQVEKGMLYPFQEEAVARLGRKALLADDPGLGKTRTALAAACRWSAFPLLVVSPLSVIGFWEEEAERVLGVRPVRIRTAADGPAALERGIGVINPERLKEVLDFPFRGLILDESHLYKNPLARLSNGQWVYVTQRVRHAAELARRAEFVWLLS
ncbi:MAG: SNF2-related protein, partial [Candidatus Hadarchaeales archaeon]